MKRVLTILLWTAIVLGGVAGLGAIAFERGEHLNAGWFVIAAVCTYLVAYRFYSAFLSTKVFLLDARRATPAERLEDGRDFVPTNKWVLMGHHFAAIAGPGPLVGPTLAAQFGYLPGTLWLILGAALGGCVQDFTILVCSIRRDGKSLGQMAREEVSKRGGSIAVLAVLAIMVILLAVVALVIVKALKESPWGTFTLVMTIPIALLMGVYLRIRPAGAGAGSFPSGICVDSAGGSRRAVGERFAGRVGGVHLVRFGAGDRHHRVRICCIGVAGVAAAGPARLPQRIRQDRGDVVARGRDRVGASGAANAGANAIRRRQWPGLRRKSFPVLFHHHRMRSDQRIPFADFFGHYSQNDHARDPCPVRRLWRNAHRIVRGGDGHGGGLRVNPRRLLRNQ